MSPSNWETRCQELLSECNILDVIAIQLEQFSARVGTGPEIILLDRSLKGPLIRELFRQHNITPSVIEPIWINVTPLTFSNLGSEFLILRNKRKGVEISL